MRFIQRALMFKGLCVEIKENVMIDYQRRMSKEEEEKSSNNNKPIKTPSDLAGMKIRVQNSQSAIEMVNSIGGSATPIAWGELYTALQSGVVDGAENNAPSFFSSKHYEVAKYFTLDEHTMVPD